MVFHVLISEFKLFFFLLLFELNAFSGNANNSKECIQLQCYISVWLNEDSAETQHTHYTMPMCVLAIFIRWICVQCVCVRMCEWQRKHSFVHSFSCELHKYVFVVYECRGNTIEWNCFTWVDFSLTQFPAACQYSYARIALPAFCRAGVFFFVSLLSKLWYIEIFIDAKNSPVIALFFLRKPQNQHIMSY